MADNSVIKRERRAFTATEKTTMWNMFQSMRNSSLTASNNDILKAVASSMGVHWFSIYRIVKEKNDSGILKPPKKTKMRLTIMDTIDDNTLCAIKNIVHKFLIHNEIPTLDKILKKINEDGTLGVIKRTTLHKILKKIGFKFNRRGWKGSIDTMLNENLQLAESAPRVKVKKKEINSCNEISKASTSKHTPVSIAYDDKIIRNVQFKKEHCCPEVLENSVHFEVPVMNNGNYIPQEEAEGDEEYLELPEVKVEIVEEMGEGGEECFAATVKVERLEQEADKEYVGEGEI